MKQQLTSAAPFDSGNNGSGRFGGWRKREILEIFSPSVLQIPTGELNEAGHQQHRSPHQAKVSARVFFGVHSQSIFSVQE